MGWRGGTEGRDRGEGWREGWRGGMEERGAMEGERIEGWRKRDGVESEGWKGGKSTSGWYFSHLIQWQFVFTTQERWI